MSNHRTKAERSKAKDARQMPVQDPGKHPSKRKREKPFVVEARRNSVWPWVLPSRNEWTRWGRYHSEEVARTALELATMKYRGYDFRMREDHGI